MRARPTFGLLVMLAACDKSSSSNVAPPSDAVGTSSVAAPSTSAVVSASTTASASASALALPEPPPPAIERRRNWNKVEATALPFPGASAPISLDYIAYDPAHDRVWAPVMDLGIVFVFDPAKRSFARVEHLPVAEREAKGQKRKVGPSSVAIGNGSAFIGTRATNEICIVDLATLALGKCVKLAGSPDGVFFGASRKELWITLPNDKSIVVLDASEPGALTAKETIKLEGAPEGYGADLQRGIFFTNLEDTNKTVAIDLHKHTVRATYEPKCGSDGPRGLAVDMNSGLVVVACTDHLQVIDPAHDGAPKGRIDTGAGVDNIDYSFETRLVVASAGKDGKLTVAKLGVDGSLTKVAGSTLPVGARSTVLDLRGCAYAIDPKAGGLYQVCPGL